MSAIADLMPRQEPQPASQTGTQSAQQSHGLIQIGRKSKAEITLVVLMLIAQGLFVWMLYDARNRAQQYSEQTASVVLESIASNIKLNLKHLQRSLDSVAENLRIPGLWDATPQFRDAALFDSYNQTDGIVGLMYVNHKGQLLANSGDVILNKYFGDRDYFKFHEANPGTAPYLSGPVVSRRGHGEAVIVMSRRINDAEGNFAGVAASGILLSHYQSMFEELNAGNASAISLFSTKGIVLVRIPFEQRMVGMDLSLGSLFAHILESSSGTYIGRSSIDGVERLVVFQTIGNMPFVLAYALDTTFVFAAWKRMAIIVSAISLLLLYAKATLLWRLWRVRARQQISERRAKDNVVTLSMANATLEERVSEEIAAREEAYGKLAMGQRLDAIGQLAGGIAHDINNVLQTVSSACTLLQERRHQVTEVERLSSMALAAADRGSAIARRLLAFARRDQLRAEAIDTTTLLVDMQELLTHTLGGTVAVKLEPSQPLPKLFADRMQLETVLINLATNARDAMAGGGTIWISGSVKTEGADETRPGGLPPGQYVHLSVRDSGIGMDAKTLGRAIEPFFTTKGVGKGTGLGLSMARGFAEQSGGGLDIISRHGQGTTVTIWLPVFPGQDAVLPNERDSAPHRINPTILKSATLLVVDDDDLTRSLVTDWLTAKGFGVMSADSGEAALALLADGTVVDLLMTDLSMPEMNGIELVHAARRVRADLPAIILTGNIGAASQVAIEGIAGGCTVLHKPLRLTDLPDEIAIVLDKAKAGRLTII